MKASVRKLWFWISNKRKSAPDNRGALFRKWVLKIEIHRREFKD
nr:MAG TPA: hypothetical protein [Caudoviricetes sp.]